MEERGVELDHATLNRWVIRYSPVIAVKAKSQKRETNKSWRMDERYIKVKGQWTYLYRAVDSHGVRLISCFLSTVMKRLQPNFSNKRLTIMVFLIS
ncbi:transposase, IS6 family [Bathymodiolus platifrons methanotrophic gill symbiont]|nr:transposase, IS6 family [Bathymodiolus platifrons methanotrophic gill symbiont]